LSFGDELDLNEIMLSHSCNADMKPISKEIKRLLNEEKHLDEILLEGTQKANEFASTKVKEMKKIIGF